MNMIPLSSGSGTLVQPLLRAWTTCKSAFNRLQAIKTILLREFRLKVNNRERMLRLALQEAEALAHETGFPLLTFPLLAREKLEAVAVWSQREQAMRRAFVRKLAMAQPARI